MKIILKEKLKREESVIGILRYGTVVTNVTGNPDSVYIKLNKTNVGKGLELSFPRNHSVLINLKTGGIRAIQGSEIVKVLDGELSLHEVDSINYEK